MRNICTIFCVLIAVFENILCQEVCGKQKSAHQLIYGGSVVARGEWPWVVSLFEKHNNEFLCSANLISHQHLLTGTT